MHRRDFLAMRLRYPAKLPSVAPASGASRAPSSASTDVGGQSASAATTAHPGNTQSIGFRPPRRRKAAASPAARAPPAAAAAPVPATAPAPGDVTAHYVLSGAADGAVEVHDDLGADRGADSVGDDSGGGSADEKDDGIAAVGRTLFCAPHSADCVLVIDADTRAARTIACSVEGNWWGLAQVDRTLFCAPFAADAVLTIDAPPPPMAAQVAEALGAGNARAGAECLRTPDAPVMCEILCALNVILVLGLNNVCTIILLALHDLHGSHVSTHEKKS